MKLTRSILIVAATALLSTSVLSAEMIRYQGQPGSKVKLDGTSTMHPWTVQSGVIGGAIEFESNTALDPAKALTDLKVTPKVSVNIPVSSLKSGKSLMDEVMHDAMKIKDHKNITYTLKEMKPKEHKAGQPLQFDTKGELTLAGTKKEIDMVVTMEPIAPNKLKTTGTKDLKMTDFGIKPPAPAIGLGLLKTGDDVKVTFEWVTARKDEKKTASTK